MPLEHFLYLFDKYPRLCGGGCPTSSLRGFNFKEEFAFR
jgi:hypothetical protein